LTKPNHRVYGDGGVHLRALPAMDTYDAVHVTLGNGKSVDGVLLNQDSYSLQLMGDDNQLHMLDRSQVKAIANKPPLMPTDYDKRLTKDEFADTDGVPDTAGAQGAAHRISATECRSGLTLRTIDNTLFNGSERFSQASGARVRVYQEIQQKLPGGDTIPLNVRSCITRVSHNYGYGSLTGFLVGGRSRTA